MGESQKPTISTTSTRYWTSRRYTLIADSRNAAAVA